MDGATKAGAAIGLSLVTLMVAGGVTYMVRGPHEGVKSVRFVSAETDDAGRIAVSNVEVTFLVKTGRNADTCTILFFDAAGKELFAPNSTTTGGNRRIRPYDTTSPYRTKSATYTQQIQVGGVPATARLDC